VSERVPLRIDLHGGPDYQPLLSGVPVTCGMRAGCVSLAPGAECGRHTTGAHEETLVFLEGAGAAQVADAAVMDVRAGQVLYIPPRTEHNMKGGETGLRYIYVVAPAAEVAPEKRP
jgi:quercetin dioxygenase-like cupin family protein